MVCLGIGVRGSLPGFVVWHSRGFCSDRVNSRRGRRGRARKVEWRPNWSLGILAERVRSLMAKPSD